MNIFPKWYDYLWEEHWTIRYQIPLSVSLVGGLNFVRNIFEIISLCDLCCHS